MRIIKPSRVREYAARHPVAGESLARWLKVAAHGQWKRFADTRATFGAGVDPVTVASGRTVTVFDIQGNRFRLVTAIHYNTGMLFVLDFLSHAEYDKERWKRTL